MDYESYYRVYSNYLKNTYGQKVYKLPVNIPCSCPNRDGTKGFKGCIFCGAKGSGNELLSEHLSVTEQLQKNKELIQNKYHADLFIAYFQSFSNTYLNDEDFKTYMNEAANFDNIVELAIATRPDCIEDSKLIFLKELKEKKNIDITIELGLQTSNEKTLEILNRQHTLKDYIEAAKKIKDFGLKLCTHVITDLPWDSDEDVIETAKVINQADSDFVKIHSLYVEKSTELERMYLNGLNLLSDKDYIRRTIKFLEHLKPTIIIERLIGRVPESDSVIANWHKSWWKVRDEMISKMKEENNYQGGLFNGTGNI